MKLISNYIKPLYLTTLFYTGIAAVILLFVLRFFFPWLGFTPYIIFLLFLALCIADYILLFLSNGKIIAFRTHADRLSNGDENLIEILVDNRYPVKISIVIIDEIPHQFQRRDIHFSARIAAYNDVAIQYHLRPVKRGVYNFGFVNTMVRSPIKLLQRRFKHMQPKDVSVYPSYIQMRKYQLMAISNRLSEVGVKKIRRLGHSMEFEQIKEYVQGDDYRTLNWKATARKGQLMVNNFTDEKSQQIYCIIDKGRVMKMPFEGLSLLDYAINASLVLSNVALLKQDKARPDNF